MLDRKGDREMAETTEGMAQWLANWKVASVRLTELRRQDLQHVDISRVIEDLDDAFELALRTATPSTTSGLVQFQALLAKGQR